MSHLGSNKVTALAPRVAGLGPGLSGTKLAPMRGFDEGRFGGLQHMERVRWWPGIPGHCQESKSAAFGE